MDDFTGGMGLPDTHSTIPLMWGVDVIFFFTL